MECRQILERDEAFAYAENSALLIVRKGAITRNLSLLRKRSGKEVIAVVKEDGYGLGLEPLSTCLWEEGVRFFAVAQPKEALQLRALLPEAEILLLTPVLLVETAVRLTQKNIIFLLGSSAQGDILRDALCRTALQPRVHIKLDTGLGRYGFCRQEWETIPYAARFLRVEGFYTHITGQGGARAMRKSLHEYLDGLAYLRTAGIQCAHTHIGGSKAALTLCDAPVSALRVGSALIGHGAPDKSWPLEDAVRLYAPVAQEAERPKGFHLGYGRACVLQKPTRVGLVRVGHGDGVLLRAMDQRGTLRGVLSALRACALRETPTVCCKDTHLPILGGIGVNHLLIDLGQDTRVGDFVTLYVNPLFVRGSIARVWRG